MMRQVECLRCHQSGSANIRASARHGGVCGGPLRFVGQQAHADAPLWKGNREMSYGGMRGATVTHAATEAGQALCGLRGLRPYGPVMSLDDVECRPCRKSLAKKQAA